MGCDASVLIVDGRPDQLDAAVARIADLESRWSRFRSESEVTSLNRQAGTAVKVTADTRLLVSTSIAARAATSGLFDALVGRAVIAAGYDRTIDEVQGRAVVRTGQPEPTTRLASITVDHEAGTITIPIGSMFDPGALGKGMAADLLVDELIADGAAGACVELGGEVRVAGLGPIAEDGVELGWNVGIADPFAPQHDLVVASVADGAIATSSTLKRRWRTADGSRAHHVIDPRTGSPSTSSVVAATVIAANGTTAETLATAAIVAGTEEAIRLVEDLGASALLWSEDGRRTVVGPFEAFLVEMFPLDDTSPERTDGLVARS